MKPLTWPSSTSFAQMIVMSLKVALPIQRFDPFSTQLSPSRVAVVRRPCAESEPESGSVRPNAPMTSPLASFGIHSSRCSCEPHTLIGAGREPVLHAGEGGDRRVDARELERDEPAEHGRVLERLRLVPRERECAEFGERLHDLHRELRTIPVVVDDRLHVGLEPRAKLRERLLLGVAEEGLVGVEVARESLEGHDCSIASWGCSEPRSGARPA